MAQTHERPDRASPPATPRWMKLSGLIVIVLVLLVIALHLTGYSPGGPGSHSMPMSVVEYGAHLL
jgi:hypothetical protein